MDLHLGAAVPSSLQLIEIKLNLCTLQALSNYLLNMRLACSRAAACKVYQTLVEQQATEQYRNSTVNPSMRWAKTLPWLFYPSGSSRLFLDSDDVDTELLFRGGALTNGQASKLTFVAAMYSLGGNYQGLEVITDQLQVLCVAPQTLLPMQPSKEDVLSSYSPLRMDV